MRAGRPIYVPGGGPMTWMPYLAAVGIKAPTSGSLLGGRLLRVVTASPTSRKKSRGHREFRILPLGELHLHAFGVLRGTKTQVPVAAERASSPMKNVYSPSRTFKAPVPLLILMEEYGRALEILELDQAEAAIGLLAVSLERVQCIENPQRFALLMI